MEEDIFIVESFLKNKEMLLKHPCWVSEKTIQAIKNLINKYKEQEEQIEEYKLNVKEAMHEAQENARIFRKEQEKTNEYRKMIGLMAYRLNEFANLGVLIDCPAEYDGVKDLRNCPRDKNCVRCIIDYFKKKAREENETN